jgi:hypothetical protein
LGFIWCLTQHNGQGLDHSGLIHSTFWVIGTLWEENLTDWNVDCVENILVWFLMWWPGIWNDRGGSSACYVFGICKSTIPSEIWLVWNSGAQFWGEDCWQWNRTFIDI